LKKNTYSTRKIAFLGLMLGIIIVLLHVERMLPPFPFFPPNFKLGLSNIIVMFAIFFVGVKDAFTLGILKAFFNMLMRGYVGGILSLTGGMLSITIISLFSFIFKKRISLVALSILGALSHNIGQLVMASFLLNSPYLFMAFLPYLMIAGVILGTFTGISANTIMPIFKRIYVK